MKVAFGVEYNGSGFSGWQRQANRISVQEVLEQAVSRVANEPVSVVCAGRTDAGVHAIQQVVHFRSQAHRSMYAWRMGCNSQLPPSVRVVWAHPVGSDFHARSSAIARFYRYIILNRPTHSAHSYRFVNWCYQPLDVEYMIRGSEALIGEHDFTSFRASACQSKSANRHLYHIGIRREQERIIIDVVGNAFLHHMVRNIVGVLMEIGKGDKPPQWSRQVLLARDRKAGGVTAPPDGLYLAGIYYPQQYKLPCDPMFDILPHGVKRIDRGKA